MLYFIKHIFYEKYLILAEGPGVARGNFFFEKKNFDFF